MLSKSPAINIPAQDTITSSPPYCRTASRTIAATDCSSATLACTPIAVPLPYCPSSSPASRCAPAPLRSATTTYPPCAAMPRAMPSPNPCAPPVTMQIFPSIRLPLTSGAIRPCPVSAPQCNISSVNPSVRLRGSPKLCAYTAIFTASKNSWHAASASFLLAPNAKKPIPSTSTILGAKPFFFTYVRNAFPASSSAHKNKGLPLQYKIWSGVKGIMTSAAASAFLTSDATCVFVQNTATARLTSFAYSIRSAGAIFCALSGGGTGVKSAFCFTTPSSVRITRVIIVSNSSTVSAAAIMPWFCINASLGAAPFLAAYVSNTCLHAFPNAYPGFVAPIHAASENSFAHTASPSLPQVMPLTIAGCRCRI